MNSYFKITHKEDQSRGDQANMIKYHGPIFCVKSAKTKQNNHPILNFNSLCGFITLPFCLSVFLLIFTSLFFSPSMVGPNFSDLRALHLSITLIFPTHTISYIHLTPN